MTAIVTIEQAIDHVVLAAHLRMRELEAQCRNECGEWSSSQFKAEHAQLASAIKTVEAAHPSVNATKPRPDQ